MTTGQRLIRRRQLDRLLAIGRTLPQPPSDGWIKAIREALGMSLEALASRLGLAKQSAHQLEQAEVDGSITVRRLRTAADALECDLVIMLVPRQSLEEQVKRRASAAARTIVLRAGHSMTMEDQTVADQELQDLIDDTAANLIRQSDPRIWQ